MLYVGGREEKWGVRWAIVIQKLVYRTLRILPNDLSS